MRLHRQGGFYPALVALLAGFLLAGCETTPTRTVTLPTSSPKPNLTMTPVMGPSVPTPGEDGFPDKDTIPRNVAQTPDAVPHKEPRSASGNPPSYEVFGKIYHVLDNGKGFEQEGYASWYGRKFQGKPTASGEPYDMFKMTAAHKTLPIPSYARVTDLENGKSVVVRINDRGPFHHGRIVDLSYAAAARLGMLGHGSTRVELEALVPSDPTETLTASNSLSTSPSAGKQIPTAYHPGGKDLYLQAGIFTDPINAVSMRDQLRSKGILPLTLRSETLRQASMTQVLVGPFETERERKAMRERLRAEHIQTLPVE